MKLIEIVIGMIVLMFVMFAGIGIFSMTKMKYILFLNQLEIDSKKMSLYNYSNYLVANLTTGESASIYFSGNSFLTGLQGEYPYVCEYQTGSLIHEVGDYTGIFCAIQFNEEMIYNYKVFNN